MIKIKLKPDGSTQKGNSLKEKYLVLICTPLISTTLAEETASRLQTLKLAGFKPLYLLVFFFKRVV